jgi:deoxyribonuclease-4
MPYLGAHMSIAGGLPTAVERAVEHGCDTLQIFTKNASQWRGKPVTNDEAAAFRAAAKAAGLRHVTAHDSYLINLAAPDDELYRKSIDAFADEIDRADRLGLAYLVTHPGAHVGSGEAAGLAKVAAALDEVHARLPAAKVKVLLETTAGQGSTLGWRFEHLDAILSAVAAPDRLGVCFDTCHVFAAGYGLATDAEYDATMQEFDRVVGLKQIRAFHVNDSVKPLGSRVDRHAGLGLGQIGEHAFRRLVTDGRFRRLPMILETPKEDADGNPMDPVNLGRLRAFLAEAAAA